MKILARRVPQGLVAADAVAAEDLRKLKVGDTVVLEVKKARNPRHHALYWALVSKVWDNVDHKIYPTKDRLHDALKFAAGIRETFINLETGEEMERVGSTAFESMDQTQFSDFYERVCDLIAVHFLPGVTKAELRSEVEEMIGVRHAA